MLRKSIVALALACLGHLSSAQAESHHNIDKTQFFDLVYTDQQGAGVQLVARIGGVQQSKTEDNCFVVDRDIVVTDALIETDLRTPASSTDGSFGIQIWKPGEGSETLFSAMPQGETQNMAALDFTGGVIVTAESRICFLGDAYYLLAPQVSRRHYLASGRVVGYVLGDVKG